MILFSIIGTWLESINFNTLLLVPFVYLTIKVIARHLCKNMANLDNNTLETFAWFAVDLSFISFVYYIYAVLNSSKSNYQELVIGVLLGIILINIFLYGIVLKRQNIISKKSIHDLKILLLVSLSYFLSIKPFYLLLKKSIS